MTDDEANRFLRRQYTSSPAAKRRIRKGRLKMRFKGERLDTEIERTREKLSLLLELRGH